MISSETEIGNPHILDTEEGRRIACHPHIVGDELKELCHGAAKAFRKTLEWLRLLESDGTTLLHILRGGAGYRVSEVLPKGIPIARVRTEYREDGYRAHTNDPRRIRVTYTSLPESDGLDSTTIIIPDTFATGRSAEAALLELLESGIEPRRVIIYGFIAIPGLKRIGALCSLRDIEFHSFSICDISQLAWNKYDMPVYGPDESLFKARGKDGRLGSIINIKTLKEILPKYIAGLDQPGDWSERQLRLFNGQNDEMGDIQGHLMKSIDLIGSLREINSNKPWYGKTQDEIAKTELNMLMKALKPFM
jgi:uracil phosphoribosyltransferase